MERGRGGGGMRKGKGKGEGRRRGEVEDGQEEKKGGKAISSSRMHTSHRPKCQVLQEKFLYKSTTKSIINCKAVA